MPEPTSLDDIRARQAAAREAMATAQDRVGHMHPAAIARCQLCNADGYRGGVICDHVDHAAATTSGRAAVRQVLADIRARKVDRKAAHV